MARLVGARQASEYQEEIAAKCVASSGSAQTPMPVETRLYLAELPQPSELNVSLG